MHYSGVLIHNDFYLTVKIPVVIMHTCNDWRRLCFSLDRQRIS